MSSLPDAAALAVARTADSLLEGRPLGGLYGRALPERSAHLPLGITVDALDADRLTLPDAFIRADILAAAKGHVLASGAAELTCTTNAKATK